MDMGFPLEGCKKAVFHTKNAGAEAAMNWVMEHMEDPGILQLFACWLILYTFFTLIRGRDIVFRADPLAVTLSSMQDIS